MYSNNTTTNNEHNLYSDAMLPELNQNDIEVAESANCKTWVLDKMGPRNIGRFNWVDDMGLGVQVVTEGTMRCFAAANEELTLRCIAMVKHTCEAVGIVFETEGYTVLIQPDSGDDATETESVDSLGMEVA